jgi:hypothetical protein
MWNVKTKAVPVLAGALGTIENDSENIWTTCVECMTSRNYRKQPYWALRTYLATRLIEVQNVYHEKYYAYRIL